VSDKTRAVEPQEGGGLNPLAGLRDLVDFPRAISEMTREVRLMRESVERLTEAVDRLEAIQGFTESMDEEVKQMRAAVERIEPQLEDVRKFVRPLGRLTGILGRRDRTAEAELDLDST
jgi:predicted nuclease with TOPRIM domain